MKELKVMSPNGDVMMVTERAFEYVYKHQGYRLYVEPTKEPIEQAEEPTEETEAKKKSRKVKKVEE